MAGKGGARSNAGRPKKRKTVALATVEAAHDIAQTLKEFMDIGLAALGREAPGLIQLEIDMAKQDPTRTVVKQVGGKEVKIQVYDKDIARLSQGSRQFLLKTLFDMTASTNSEKRTPAEEAMRELLAINIQVNGGEVIIGETQLESSSGILVGQAGDTGQPAEGGARTQPEEFVEGTARSIS